MAGSGKRYRSMRRAFTKSANPVHGLFVSSRTLGPDSFDVLAFTPEQQPLSIDVPGYRVRGHVYQEVCGYGVSFLHLYRPPTEPKRALPLPLG